MVTIELFGIPRIRAGRRQFEVQAATVGEALTGLAQLCPTLEGAIVEGDHLHPAYRLSINGDRFVADPQTRLDDGDALWLLSADVGG